jgi:hypothetical protein
MVELPAEVVELLRANEARTVAQRAQIDQLSAQLRELEEWQQMSVTYGPEYGND